MQIPGKPDITFSRKPALTSDPHATSGPHGCVPSPQYRDGHLPPPYHRGPLGAGPALSLPLPQSRRTWLSNEGMSSLPKNPQAVCLTLFDTQMRHGELEFTAFAQACTQGQRQSWGSSAGKSAPPPSHSSSCGFSLSKPPSQLPRGPAVCLGAVLPPRQDPTPA